MVLSPPLSHRNFSQEARERIGLHPFIKIAGFIVGMAGFFYLYLLLLAHPVFPVTTMPRTAVDRLIPFRPWTLALYLSLWFYVPLGFALLPTRRELSGYAARAAAISAVGFACFFFWPTAVPPMDLSSVPHAFAFLKLVDASGNACPSLHVAFAVFTAMLGGRIFRQLRAPVVLHVGNWFWCGGIVYSTLATGQHVALDALAGAALGALGALPQRAQCDQPAVTNFVSSAALDGAGVRR